MDAILISFAICVLGVMVTVLIFAVAMRPQDDEAVENPRPRPDLPSEQFFLDDSERSDSRGQAEAGAPTNELLLDLERHVRTEHEAAQAFLRGPTPDSLHAPSDSPLWH